MREKTAGDFHGFLPGETGWLLLLFWMWSGTCFLEQISACCLDVVYSELRSVRQEVGEWVDVFLPETTIR